MLNSRYNLDYIKPLCWALLYTNHTIDQLHPEAIGVITTNLDKPSVHENNCFCLATFCA